MRFAALLTLLAAGIFAAAPAAAAVIAPGQSVALPPNSMVDLSPFPLIANEAGFGFELSFAAPIQVNADNNIGIELFVDGALALSTDLLARVGPAMGDFFEDFGLTFTAASAIAPFPVDVAFTNIGTNALDLTDAAALFGPPEGPSVSIASPIIVSDPVDAPAPPTLLLALAGFLWLGAAMRRKI